MPKYINKHQVLTLISKNFTYVDNEGLQIDALFIIL